LLSFWTLAGVLLTLRSGGAAAWLGLSTAVPGLRFGMAVFCSSSHSI